MMTKFFDKLLFLFVAFTSFLWSEAMALAADGASVGIGKAAHGLASQMDEIKQLGLNVSMVIGVVLVIMGIIKLTKRSGGEDGPGKAIIFIVAGVLMLAIPAVFKLSVESIGLESGTGSNTKLEYK